MWKLHNFTFFSKIPSTSLLIWQIILTVSRNMNLFHEILFMMVILRFSTLCSKLKTPTSVCRYFTLKVPVRNTVWKLKNFPITLILRGINLSKLMYHFWQTIKLTKLISRKIWTAENFWNFHTVGKEEDPSTWDVDSSTTLKGCFCKDTIQWKSN